MFMYFPTNYVWSMAAVAALNNGGFIDEVDRACKPVLEASENGDDVGTELLYNSWAAVADRLIASAEIDVALGRRIGAGDKFYRASLYTSQAERLQAPGWDGRLAAYQKSIDLLLRHIEFIRSPAATRPRSTRWPPCRPSGPASTTASPSSISAYRAPPRAGSSRRSGRWSAPIPTTCSSVPTSMPTRSAPTAPRWPPAWRAWSTRMSSSRSIPTRRSACRARFSRSGSAVNRIGGALRQGPCAPRAGHRCREGDADGHRSMPPISLASDDRIGSIEAGKFADFVVLEEDPRDVDPMKIKDVGVVAAVLAGNVTLTADTHSPDWKWAARPGRAGRHPGRGTGQLRGCTGRPASAAPVGSAAARPASRIRVGALEASDGRYRRADRCPRAEAG